MIKDPAFLFYDGDAARDVSHMNRLERGAYFDLIQAQRKFGGYTVEQAQKILGKDFEEVWPALELILSKSADNKYFLEWVQNSIENRKEHAEKQRKRIQDYWDKKKREDQQEINSKSIPRNNHGTTVDIPLVNEIEIENENIDIIKVLEKGGMGEKEGEIEPAESVIIPAPTKKSFIPPTIPEIKYYFSLKGIPSTDLEYFANRFFDFYEKKGWMVGKNKMTNWKIAATSSLDWEDRRAGPLITKTQQKGTSIADVQEIMKNTMEIYGSNHNQDSFKGQESGGLITGRIDSFSNSILT